MTIAEIRERLTSEERVEFEEQLAHTPFDQLYAKIVLEWVLTPEERAEDRAVRERVRAGDFSGLRNLDGTPFTP
ncbi:hypothetical protein [Embleya sp. AB8]|uniref:hypothetical protein n=1 Tax=Embleya sp. AB8 TaxID=3156304 RepID=UPI003C76D171